MDTHSNTDDAMLLSLAKIEMGRYVELGSDEVKKAWRIILAKLDPPKKNFLRR